MIKWIACIAAGGFLGSISRFALINFLKKRWTYSIPIPTIIVNLSGSFFLGVLVSIHAAETFYFLFGVGFLGAYTTFSTLSMEAIQLFRSKKRKDFLLYTGISFIGGIFFAFLGVCTVKVV
ncbi:fluoride efflux transporter FluC [Niallia sp. 01092]|uniref:fluoride efflux transporter FluC n=1 Tax=unclassified Niallia TaxID=2837522 RepID=UPI003FD5416D